MDGSCARNSPSWGELTAANMLQFRFDEHDKLLPINRFLSYQFVVEF
jgi:hypothetical protein